MRYWPIALAMTLTPAAVGCTQCECPSTGIYVTVLQGDSCVDVENFTAMIGENNATAWEAEGTDCTEWVITEDERTREEGTVINVAYDIEGVQYTNEVISEGVTGNGCCGRGLWQDAEITAGPIE